MTLEERKFLQGIIMEMQEQFIEDIARGRKMEKKEVRKLADGRIFTGRKAKSLGLVDEIGTLEDAIEMAAKMVGLSPHPKVVYPRAKKRKLMDYVFDKGMDRIWGRILEMQLQETPLWFYALPGKDW